MGGIKVTGTGKEQTSHTGKIGKKETRTRKTVSQEKYGAAVKYTGYPGNWEATAKQ